MTSIKWALEAVGASIKRKAASIMDLSKGRILTPQALPKISMACAGLSRMKWKAESDWVSHSLTAATSRGFRRESRSLET